MENLVPFCPNMQKNPKFVKIRRFLAIFQTLVTQQSQATLTDSLIGILYSAATCTVFTVFALYFNSKNSTQPQHYDRKEMYLLHSMI